MPLLYPFISHNITSVRRASLTTINVLLTKSLKPPETTDGGDGENDDSGNGGGGAGGGEDNGGNSGGAGGASDPKRVSVDVKV